jgi:hydrogenase maturation factor
MVLQNNIGDNGRCIRRTVIVIHTFHKCNGFFDFGVRPGGWVSVFIGFVMKTFDENVTTEILNQQQKLIDEFVFLFHILRIKNTMPAID